MIVSVCTSVRGKISVFSYSKASGMASGSLAQCLGVIELSHELLPQTKNLLKSFQESLFFPEPNTLSIAETSCIGFELVKAPSHGVDAMGIGTKGNGDF